MAPGVNRVLAFLAMALCLGVGASPAMAHKLRPAVVAVTFDLDGTYTIEIRANAEALLADISPLHEDTTQSPNAARYDDLRELEPDALGERIEDFAPQLVAGLEVMFDGKAVQPRLIDIEVPNVEDRRRARVTTITFGGEIPVHAREFTWSYAAGFGDNILIVRHGGEKEGRSSWLANGARSEPLALDGKFVPKSRSEVAGEYLVLGSTHILPKGLDHILFVLGIFLLSLKLKPIFWQVTSFTIAHTIALGMTIYGVISLPSYIVEPLIAASIVYVGVENILTSAMKPWRVGVVFGFGLLHGMGFAGVLSGIGLPRSEFLTALVTFNLGVEFGQLAVIGLAFLAVGIWFRKRPWYRARVVVPGSAAISLAGLYWVVERTVF